MATRTLSVPEASEFLLYGPWLVRPLSGCASTLEGSGDEKARSGSLRAVYGASRPGAYVGAHRVPPDRTVAGLLHAVVQDSRNCALTPDPLKW